MVLQNLSAIILFLLQRLTVPKRGGRLTNQKRNYCIERRIFLRRMRMIESIPHPIFCRRIVDFSQIARVFFAKSIQLQRLLHGFSSVATFKYQGQLLRLIKNYFATYLGMARPFCIKLRNEHRNNVIIIQFKPKNRMWSMSIMEVNLDTYCSNVIHPISADVSISYKFGVRCITRLGVLAFLYNKKVDFPGYRFNWNYNVCKDFRVADVEFYIQRETAVVPLIVDYPVSKRKNCECGEQEKEQLFLSLFKSFGIAKDAKLY
jgi:hypothetical protein